tara:strand:+ start:945 stop:1445 length:501 start_codon:yes stop_codon:yes gene_type:complete
MDIFLLFIGLLFMLLGIIGAFLPVLPGPITGWVGLLLLHLTSVIPQDWVFLSLTLAIAIITYVLDYIIPAIGTKKFGGSKHGIYGTTIGLIIGLVFFPPFGIIIGPFVGVLIGELMHDNKDSRRALKAAVGSFIGFLFSTGLKFMVTLIYLGLFLSIFWEYKSSFI